MKADDQIKIEAFDPHILVKRPTPATGDTAPDWQLGAVTVFDGVGDAEEALRNFLESAQREGKVDRPQYDAAMTAYHSSTERRMIIGNTTWAIAPLDTATGISGTELAQMNPQRAANVIITAHTGGGDVRNAWEVLVSAIGRAKAWQELCDAITRAGVAEDTTHGDVTRKAHEIIDGIDTTTAS